MSPINEGDMILEWKLVDDRNPRFNVWKTVNTYMYNWGANKVMVSYRECFWKNIDPNKEQYRRSSGANDKQLYKGE